MDIAWIGVVGVAVGAVLSFAAAWLTEQARARRDRRARWEGRLYDAITAYATAVKMQSRTAIRAAASRWPTESTTPLSREEAHDRFARFEDERSGHWERLLFLATAETISAARAWQQDVWSMHLVIDESHPMSKDEFAVLLAHARDSRDEFWRVVRKSQQISGVLAPAPARTSEDDPTWRSKRKD